MHDEAGCRGAALTAAIREQGKDREFAAKLRRGGPEAAALRERFAKDPDARCFLRRNLLVPDGTGTGKEDAAVHLADKAEDFLEVQQPKLIAGAWERLTRSGELDSLDPNVRLVLHGVFILAMEHGPEVPCATRYVALLLEHQFGEKVSHTTVASCYRKLKETRLDGGGVDIQPGRRGRGRRSSTVIDLRPLLWETADPPEDVWADLTMLPGVAEVLEAYATEAQALRKTLAADLEEKRLADAEAQRRLLHDEAVADMEGLVAELLDEPESFTRLVPVYLPADERRRETPPAPRSAQGPTRRWLPQRGLDVAAADVGSDPTGVSALQSSTQHSARWPSLLLFDAGSLSAAGDVGGTSGPPGVASAAVGSPEGGRVAQFSRRRVGGVCSAARSRLPAGTASVLASVSSQDGGHQAPARRRAV